MSTRWSKFSLSLGFILYFSITCLKAEELSEILWSYYRPNQELSVTNLFKIYPHYANREIESINIFIAPKELKNSLVTLKIGEKSQALELPSYRPEDEKSFSPLIFTLPKTLKLKQKDITKIQFSFSDEVAVTFVKVVFKDNLTSDIEGSQFKIQLDRLEKLSSQNLYAERNKEADDVIVRITAAKELAEFPSLRSARILLERINYRGVSTDYDLRSEAFSSMKTVIIKLIQRFGEEMSLSVMEKLYHEDEEYLVRHHVLNTMAEFKSSAALMFVIINHTYSPTDTGVWGTGILEDILKKEDFSYFMDRYRPKLIEFFKSGLGLDMNDATFIWAKERACSAITASPISGLFAVLWPQTNSYNVTYNTSAHCSDAIKAIITNNDIDSTEEFRPFEKEFISIITSNLVRDTYYFPHPEKARVITAIMLGKIQTPQAKAALEKALLIKDLEENVKKSVTEALSWYK